MKRTPLPRRRHPPARGAPPRKTKRSASEFKRIYGSKARVAFVASLPCACGCEREPSVNAHTESGGVGRKGDYDTIIPLARACHDLQHRRGWWTLGLDAEGRRRAAENTEASWKSFCGGMSE